MTRATKRKASVPRASSRDGACTRSRDVTTESDARGDASGRRRAMRARAKTVDAMGRGGRWGRMMRDARARWGRERGMCAETDDV